MEESGYLENRKDLLEKFKKFPFLSAIEDDFLEEMLRLSKMRRYKDKEVITREGEYDCYMFIIITGGVRILKAGNEIAIICHQGDTFGELAIIDGETRCATVEAQGDTICLAIDAAFIDRLKPQKKAQFSAAFYKLLAEILANRLRQTDENLVIARDEVLALRKQVNPSLH